jgi:hypothetical protein
MDEKLVAWFGIGRRQVSWVMAKGTGKNAVLKEAKKEEEPPSPDHPEEWVPLCNRKTIEHIVASVRRDSLASLIWTGSKWSVVVWHDEAHLIRHIESLGDLDEILRIGFKREPITGSFISHLLNPGIVDNLQDTGSGFLLRCKNGCVIPVPTDPKNK